MFHTRIVLIVLLCGSGCASNTTGHVNLNSVAWMQTSEEYRALCLGAYNMAQQNLDHALADKSWTALVSQVPDNEEEARSLGKLPPAVILDIDETVLDTSPYQAWLVRNNLHFSQPSWNAWVREADAKPLPGALEFVQYAIGREVTVFYLSNRSYQGPVDKNGNGRMDPGEDQTDLKLHTLSNLVRLGFLPQPSVSNENAVLLRGETGKDGRIKAGWDLSDKTARRESLASDYRILLIVGDHLNDFVGTRESQAARYDRVSRTAGISDADSYRARWGRSWILLPNPAYGSWEGKLYEFRHGLSDEEKTRIKLERLDTWQ